MKRSFLIAVIAVLVVSILPQSSFAEEQIIAPSNTANETEKLVEIDESTGLFIFETNTDSVSHNDTGLSAEDKGIFQKANDYLIENGLASESGLASKNGVSSCNGSNYYDGSGLVGGTLYLNSCNADGLASILLIGGSAAQIAHFIPVYGTSIGVVSGALAGAGAGLINFNNRKNKGIAIKLVKVPFKSELYPYWIKSQ